MKLITCILMLTSIPAAAATTAQAPAAIAGTAQTAAQTPAQVRWQQYLVKERKDSFILGMCVGQTLAASATPVLIMPQQNQSAAPLDSATRAALKTAIQTCRTQIQGALKTARK